MRQIEIRTADDGAFINFQEENYQEVTEALSYLTTWALTGYGYVEIFIARDGEMTACYWKTKDAHLNNEQVGYVIGAIFHEDVKWYSFHS